MHGIPARTDQEWLDGIGTPLRVQFAEWAHDEERMEAMIATYREYNIFHHDSRVTVYPGVVEMVTRRPRRGVPHGARHQQEPGRAPSAGCGWRGSRRRWTW